MTHLIISGVTPAHPDKRRYDSWGDSWATAGRNSLVNWLHLLMSKYFNLFKLTIHDARPIFVTQVEAIPRWDILRWFNDRTFNPSSEKSAPRTSETEKNLRSGDFIPWLKVKLVTEVPERSKCRSFFRLDNFPMHSSSMFVSLTKSSTTFWVFPSRTIWFSALKIQ